jgi:hypothetical protein
VDNNEVRVATPWRLGTRQIHPPQIHFILSTTALPIRYSRFRALPLSIKPFIERIKTAIAPGCPFRSRLADILLGPKFPVFLQQLKEAVVVDQRVPFPIDMEALGGQKDAATVWGVNRGVWEREGKITCVRAQQQCRIPVPVLLAPHQVPQRTAQPRGRTGRSPSLAQPRQHYLFRNICTKEISKARLTACYKTTYVTPFTSTNPGCPRATRSA